MSGLISHRLQPNQAVNRSGYVFGDLMVTLMERFSVIRAGS